MSDVAMNAPTMKPYKPRTNRKSRYPAKQASRPPRASTAAVGVAYDAGSIPRIIEGRFPVCFSGMSGDRKSTQGKRTALTVLLFAAGLLFLVYTARHLDLKLAD